ncbi:hypothetical protein HPP92_009076 [Vanilla planifolia]|uniref:Scarecrow-like protein 23 n=1 Tax=Vanilla planifolia TaxID=51239 RepID=A0A835R750_VANPL|nr:hypothetical protein HPP92_009076 [Vanilla planifolia]
MQGEVAEDLLTLSLGVGSAKKRKRREHHHHHSCGNKTLAMALLHARERMLCLNRGGIEEDDKGLRLVRLLLLCAASIDREDQDSAAAYLFEIYRHVSLTGDSIQRVAAYFADGLLARLLAPASSIEANPTPADEFSAFTSLYSASPYYQFAHFTANQAITEAFEAEEHRNGGALHVVDLDVSHGFQWPSLIESLSEKATSSNPIRLRITGFGRNAAELRETETRLSGFARGCRNLSFEFDGKLGYAADALKGLSFEKNATIVVNLVFYLHELKSYGEISATLESIHSFNPSLLVLIDKEWGSVMQTSGFLPRFVDSLHYFAAMFDSLDDCLPAESKERFRIEKNHLGREIRNAVRLKEGEERGALVKYGTLETWKAVMESRGFEGVCMSSRSVSQAKLLLKIKSHCSAMEEHGRGAGFRISERRRPRHVVRMAGEASHHCNGVEVLFLMDFC